MKPAQPNLFHSRRDRIIEHCRQEPPHLMLIPVIATSECWMLLTAYHGGPLRALRFLLWMEFCLWCRKWRHRLVIKACDWMGWTKVVPANVLGILRHGRSCKDSRNCEYQDCISDDVPGWFKKLVRWED